MRRRDERGRVCRQVHQVLQLPGQFSSLISAGCPGREVHGAMPEMPLYLCTNFIFYAVIATAKTM
jgi:hypothetical protein